MSKRLTIVLTDEEYAALEARADADRRTVRDMAARLVTQPQQGVITITPDWTYRPVPFPPLWPPPITSGRLTTADDHTTFDPSKVTIWNNPYANCAAPSMPSLPIGTSGRHA